MFQTLGGVFSETEAKRPILGAQADIAKNQPSGPLNTRPITRKANNTRTMRLANAREKALKFEHKMHTKRMKARIAGNKKQLASIRARYLEAAAIAENLAGAEQAWKEVQRTTYIVKTNMLNPQTHYTEEDGIDDDVNTSEEDDGNAPKDVEKQDTQEKKATGGTEQHQEIAVVKIEN